MCALEQEDRQLAAPQHAASKPVGIDQLACAFEQQVRQSATKPRSSTNAPQASRTRSGAPDCRAEHRSAARCTVCSETTAVSSRGHVLFSDRHAAGVSGWLDHCARLAAATDTGAPQRAAATAAVALSMLQNDHFGALRTVSDNGDGERSSLFFFFVLLLLLLMCSLRRCQMTTVSSVWCKRRWRTFCKVNFVSINSRN
jgi:hypothetical protein